MTAELWAPVVGFPGYEVSDLGRVRGVQRWVGPATGRGRKLVPARVLEARPNRAGYPYVSLSVGGRTRNRDVHVLVLEAFVGPRPEGLEACHDNGVRTDPSLTNLRWDTVGANRRDAVQHGTHSMTRRTHCPRDHELVEPNLCPGPAARGERRCLACSRGAAHVRRERALGIEADLATVANQYHRAILEPVPA